MASQQYRLNTLAQIIYWEFEITLRSPFSNQSITIEKNPQINDFLKNLEENIFFHSNTLESFSLDDNFLRLLIELRIVTESDFNSWIEALCFDRIMSNPSSILRSLDSIGLHQIKADATTALRRNIGTNFVHLKSTESKFSSNPDITASVFEKLGSTRLSNQNGENNQHELMGLIELIFKPIRDSEHFKFGSGWWLHSIFPLVICRTDDVIVYDKHHGSWYTLNISGVYEQYIQNCLVPCDTNFKAYNYFVLLCSDTEAVFKKYGNRWYRLIMLECWEISFLFRLYSASFSKPHLELQWFYENRIYGMIKDNCIMKKMENLLLIHTIAITD